MSRAEMLGASPSVIRSALERLGVTYKKSLRHPKAEVEKQGIFYQKIQGASKGRTPHRFH
ncbi:MULTISPECIES: hypothetical protein [Holospora]|uniref:hypothetical protein n=1 Tax=Holospora TaxID=44747 RepID=UPI0003C50A25|nr:MULTISPECIES: hypothetical protein [Holospora]